MRRIHDPRVGLPVSLPAVGTLLNEPAYTELVKEYGRERVVEAIREQVASEREGAADAAGRHAAVAAKLRTVAAPRLRRVINATGVILHTNLGRAPLSQAAIDALAVAAGYSNLELDLASGKRGERAALVAGLHTALFGCEAALVVNNNAAAVLLALTALCKGKEVIVSRGQLVEIGGSFRMPDVMRLSGARMVEVGTTNRTRPADYEEAVTPRSAALLRVHTSNFRVSGFTESASLAELAGVARRHGLLLLDDLGSGAAEPIGDEPTVAESLKHSDVVTFSGDKLLGAPQAGLILGRKSLVERARKDPLARALRVDKLTLAALEATLPAYDEPARALREIPALAMLAQDDAALERRARALAGAIRAADSGLAIGVERGAGEVGGGALPLARLEGWVVTAEWKGRPVEEIDRRVRAAEPPVIGYIRAGKFRMDVRTLGDDEIAEVAQAFANRDT